MKFFQVYLKTDDYEIWFLLLFAKDTDHARSLVGEYLNGKGNDFEIEDIFEIKHNEIVEFYHGC